MFLNIAENLTKALEVDNLPFAQEADGIGNIRIFHHAENIFIGAAGFLFCCQILK